MLARIKSAAVLGIDAYLVDVETDIAHGLPSFATVGLPLGAVKEGKERVGAAIANSDFEFPLRRITVNLAPADVRKDGSAFDLPIALGILTATEQLRPSRNGRGQEVPALSDYLVVGELGLEGDIRPVRGALSMALAARASGMRGVVVPIANLAEASVVDHVTVLGARRLRDVADFFAGAGALKRGRATRTPSVLPPRAQRVDFADVRAQEQAKRALEVAAAGAHNLLMIGPPGSGKTMLARRIPTILPPMTLDEALETTKIHSVAGLLPPASSLVRSRPFRAPHHTISEAGLVGGGAVPRPGEVSLAHRGVLFMDELPEFRRRSLDVLRQPLEEGVVHVVRVRAAVSFPARFQLVAAMNPCPCGKHAPGAEESPCECDETAVRRYAGRVSGPLLDRIDMCLDVSPVRWRELRREPRGEPSAVARERVMEARERARARWSGRANADMGVGETGRFCRTSGEAARLLRSAVQRFGLSARAYHRVLRVARTVADLGGAGDLTATHVAEAVQYRASSFESL